MMLLMLQGGSPDWTVILSTAASIVSAAVALAATIIAARTYQQQKADKEEELSYKRPKFTLIRDTLEVVNHVAGDHTVNPFYRLTLTFQNRNVHPAAGIELEGKVLQGDKKLFDFVNQPVGEVDQNETFEVAHNIPRGAVTEQVCYVRVMLTYRDARTQREHSQAFYRKFYGLPEDVNLTIVELLELDRSEWADYIGIHKKVLEARKFTLGGAPKQVKSRDKEE
jgi:hypothetical protein